VIQQGRRLLERALLNTADIPDPLASIAWTILGFNQTYLGDGRSAIHSYRKALETAYTVPFPGGVELVEATLAWLECDFERSWRIASSAVEVMTTKTRRAPANLVGFAKSAIYAGDLEGAADCYERARRLAAELGDPIAEANALRLTAVVEALEGNHDAAWKWAHQSLVMHDPARSPLGAAQASSSMALIALLSGDEVSAETWSRIAIERVCRQFDVQTISVTLPVIALLSVRDDRPEHAAKLFGWLDAYVESLGHVHHPTTRTLEAEVRESLASSDPRAVRSWSAQGAAMPLSEMLRFAVS
jgi:tetratricopeptide (TPR) repeat protein